MIQKIISSVQRFDLIPRGSSVLAAVSGGADSIALLSALHDLAGIYGIRLTAAHLNHMIRGKRADADERFVRSFAAKLNIPFVAERIDVPRLADKKKISIEMAAREARYDFLAGTAKKIRADIIVTAHTADDQAETIVLKLCRGAGMRGLAGIPRQNVINGVKIVRPILDVTRSEVEAYLKGNLIGWREDETNAETVYLRNKVRHRILPLLEKELNPDLKNTLARTADIIGEEDRWLENLALVEFARCKDANGALKLAKISRLPVPVMRRVIRLWLTGNGVDPESVDYDSILKLEKMITKSRTTGSIELADGFQVRAEYSVLALSRNKTVKSFSRYLKVPGITDIPEIDRVVKAAYGRGIVKARSTVPGAVPASATVSAEKIRGRKIFVRQWKEGDRMRPFGMQGSKKVQDIFVDAKLPEAKRRQVPVFLCEDEIIWIPGYRIAQGWEVGKDRKNLKLTIT